MLAFIALIRQQQSFPKLRYKVPIDPYCSVREAQERLHQEEERYLMDNEMDLAQVIALSQVEEETSGTKPSTEFEDQPSVPGSSQGEVGIEDSYFSDE